MFGDWIELAVGRDQWRSLANTAVTIRSSYNVRNVSRCAAAVSQGHGSIELSSRCLHILREEPGRVDILSRMAASFDAVNPLLTHTSI